MSSINKLHVFSKNTDAFAAQRGYNYQTLKTLETWVYNFVENIEEDIYCEYEEDIFQKNDVKGKLKFRQLKLYSRNFSFSSDEIKKCIAHFFMLHVKSDYNDFDKEFFFETNAEISRKNLNNEADLLKSWFSNQNNLSEEQLKEYSEKIKTIVTEYIQQQQKAIAKDVNEELLKEAIDVFSNLDDTFWHNFTKLIKWQFIGVSSELEFSNTKKRIEELLFKLPFNEVENNIQQLMGVLLEKVFTKANQENPEERKLTLSEFEYLILNIGSEEDKWYSEKYAYYEQLENIDEFRIGEFYEILDLVNYCRRKKYLIKHKDKWNSLIKFYTENSSIDKLFRRKAIYELIFLNNEFHEVDYTNLKDRIRPTGNLLGYESKIRYYFTNLDIFVDVDELENCQNILNLLIPIIIDEKVDISYKEYKKWIVLLYKTLCKKLLNVKDINEKCSLLEQKANFLMMINKVRNRNPLEFMILYDEILQNVENAPLFKVSQFGDRINKYIKIHIDNHSELKVIMALENFSEKLAPFVSKRDGKIKLAKQQVERGVQYLKQTDPFLMLKALENFHKAKDNYFQEDTMKGYVLSLRNYLGATPIETDYRKRVLTFEADSFVVFG